jgi:tetratricopeptide (TPR) repeat protein
LAPDVPDISQEILLGRTLLEQGHLGTAQRVLVKICQDHPENAEAFRGLSELLRRKGDDARARIVGDYAKDLRDPPPKDRHTTPSPAKSDAKPRLPPSPSANSSPGIKTKLFFEGETGVPQVAPPGPPATMPHAAAKTPVKPPLTGEFDMPQVAPGPAATMPHAGNAAAAPAPEPVVPQPAAPQPDELQVSIANVPLAPAHTDAPRPAGPETSQPASVAATPAKGSTVPRKKSKKGKVLAFLIFLGLLGGGGWYGYRTWQQRQPPRPSYAASEELDGALTSGSLERMIRTREKARAALAVPQVDPDGLVRLALVDAVLSLDYGVASSKSAEESLGRMPPPDPNQPQRQALVEAVRGALSLDAGDRVAALQHVQSGLGKAGPQSLPILLVLSARLHWLSGDLTTAGQELDRAAGMAPDFAPAVADWALAKLDAGDPASARRVLKDFLGKNRSATRVHLAAAEVERALGETAWKRHMDIACHGDNRAARRLRAACTLAAAQDARLDGERASAIRKAKAAVQGVDDARLLADAAMVLALLGEIDAADELLERARKAADNSVVPLAWASLAVRLGRGQLDGPAPPSDHPVLSERALLVLRAQYLKGGGPALSPVVKNVAAGLPELDPDLRTYMELASEAAPSKADRANLERRAERGNPLASFVVGVLAARESDHKLAAKRLEKAMSGHGDACRAALLYLQAQQAEDKPPQPNRNALRALRERCAACPLPEI